MKKGIIIILATLISLSIFWLGFDYHKLEEPNTYYQVYLDGEVLGVVKSKTKLEKYIDKQNDSLKEIYGASKVYSPNGLEIKKIVTYEAKVDSLSEIYERIKAKKAFTIKGFQLTIKDGDNSKVVYAINKDIFKDALEQTMKTFVGEEAYQKYIDNKQEEIKATGTIIENVYIQNSKTIKETYISTDEKIYTDYMELSKYLLYGPNIKKTTYKVKVGDNIEDVAFKNEISVEEFLISNTEFTSPKNLLFPGQIVTIAATDPQISVVVEEFTIEDVSNKYKTIERYDANRPIGDDVITQKGQNGTDRVAQDVQIINGEITYVKTESKIELKPTINQEVIIGKKSIPTVGNLKVWGWPTNGGWKLSSLYGYRISPITRKRELHNGIDIAGTGYGSPIYASNNGIVDTAEYHPSYGNYVVVNHNNGYYTLYAHMSKIKVKVGQTVARGTILGLVGSTGASNGPHLHFTVYIGKPYSPGSYTINPLTLFK